MTIVTDTNTLLKAGEISLKQTKRGLEFHAWNHERQRLIHVGTLRGVTYEKGNCTLLRQPQLSICLPQSEYGAVVEAGAEFFRAISPDKSAKYTISVAGFKEHAEAYYNRGYGPQWRCPVQFFSYVGDIIERRNEPQHIDTTPAPQYEQPSLFST
jgi:hypothetical protein